MGRLCFLDQFDSNARFRIDVNWKIQPPHLCCLFYCKFLYTSLSLKIQFLRYILALSTRMIKKVELFWSSETVKLELAIKEILFFHALWLKISITCRWRKNTNGSLLFYFRFIVLEQFCPCKFHLLVSNLSKPVSIWL